MLTTINDHQLTLIHPCGGASLLRRTTTQLLQICIFIAVAIQPAIGKSLERPNLVLIVADDLGWSDVGCYGGDLVETPHLDRLAGQGVRFTDAYAMSVCSPSRAALLTGKHAARLKITIWSEGALQGPANRPLEQAKSLPDLPHSEETLAERFQAAGYLTALVGKWHLGRAGHFPETQGFDVNIGGNHWGAADFLVAVSRRSTLRRRAAVCAPHGVRKTR